MPARWGCGGTGRHTALKTLQLGYRYSLRAPPAPGIRRFPRQHVPSDHLCQHAVLSDPVANRVATDAATQSSSGALPSAACRGWALTPALVAGDLDRRLR